MLIHNLVATGSISYNGVNISYVTGSQTSLDGLNQFSASVNTTTGSLNSTTGSLNTATGSLFTASGSFSTRVTNIEGNYATTGSNVFLGAQTVCANITSTGTIIAQTLNVQQVTSSIVYSSGSNVFGCDLSNVQQFTGSVRITGSLNVAGNTCVVSICSPSFVGGTVSGTTIYGSTAICGGVICGGATTLTGALSGTSATFSATYSAGGTVNIMQWQRSGGAVAADMTYNDANTSMNFGTSTAHALNLKTGGTTALSISSTGAATFSNNVTLGGAGNPTLTVTGTDGAYTSLVYLNAAGGGASKIFANGGSNTLYLGTNNVERLTISSTGAATFSSSVTATGGTASYSTSALPTATISTTTTGAINAAYTSIRIGARGQSGQDQSVAITNVPTADGNSAIAFTTMDSYSYAERMRITSGGNVGIGTSSPSAKLDIASVSLAEEGLTVAKSYIGGGDLVWTSTIGGTDGGVSFTGIKVTQKSSGGFQASSNVFQTLSNNSPLFTVLYSGNVGIGTTAPNFKLDVYGGNARINSGTYSFEYGITGGSGYIQAYNNTGATAIPILFYTGISEAMRITSDGNVLVGGTTTADLGTTNRLGSFRTDTAGNVYLQLAGTVSTTISHAYFYNSSGLGGSIQTTSGTISLVNGSDYRMKTNIEPLQSGLSKISLLNPVLYEYKVTEGHVFEGFIAHELQEVIPNAVFGEKDKMNEDGTPKYQGVDMVRLIPYLTKAIQEQQCKINILESCLGIN